MGKISNQAKGIMGQIDAIITMLERYNSSTNIFDGLTITSSPLTLLLELLRHVGFTKDELIEWLSKYIVEMTPIVEIALKGILLSKLKSNIDCNLDPRIPKYLREEIGGVTDVPIIDEMIGNNVNVDNLSGIEIDLSSIDCKGILNFSPMSDKSQYMYFGTKKYYEVEGINEKFYSYDEIVKECLNKDIDSNLIKKISEIDSIYELVRAKDMNAFLWFVLHKAKFLNVQDIKNFINLDSKESILSVINREVTIDNNISLGGCYTQKDKEKNSYSVMGLCIKNTPQYFNNNDIKESSTNHIKEYSINSNNIGSELNKLNNNIKSYNYVIVPTTNKWNGCNWYVNRSMYFDFWDKKERDYGKEFALFRLTVDNPSSLINKKFKFTIKPAPNIIVPNIEFSVNDKITENENFLNIKYTGDMPWNFHRIVFNDEGKQDFWGKYSVVVSISDIESEGQYSVYKIKDPIKNVIVEDINLYVNKKTREYKLISKKNGDIRRVLYECYPGFTIYEFNYDFIMGMRFFDATVITAELIQALSNVQLGVEYRKTNGEYQMRISKIVKQMLETNGYETSDCFYTFSNEEYDKMQEESELKRAQLYPFQDEKNKSINVDENDVYSILNEFNSKATLEENISVINRAITKATATISQEMMPENKYSGEFNFITQSIEVLAAIFVEALLSPKLLMVLAINQKIMGEEMPKDITTEKMLESFLNIIVAMINEIIDMILKKLLEVVLEKVKMLLEAAKKILIFEQVEYYVRLMSKMIQACMFKLPNNPNLVSTLDNVDYADIDINDTPITNEC